MIYLKVSYLFLFLNKKKEGMALKIKQELRHATYLEHVDLNIFCAPSIFLMPKTANASDAIVAY